VPEGQISHRNAGDFSRALVGRPLVRVWSEEPRLTPQHIPQRLAGDTVTGAEARGKHHLLRFASGRVLHSHLMMNGVWRLVPEGRPVFPGGLFLGLAVPGWTAALYRCPQVRLLEPHEPLPASVRRLGPDLLGATTVPGADTARALAAAEPTRQVGDAVLDQRLVAGIGNVYKSETLFLAGVDPWRALGSLTDDERTRIGEIAAELLAKGVRDRGRISTYEEPGRPPGRPSGAKWVYGRRGRPCRRCGTPIRSRGQGDDNRTTYWCPACQR
jgi:endonuclease VIII